jgi:drug/metabolite transporter (DMT)-like permease
MTAHNVSKACRSRPMTICMTHMSHFHPQGCNLYFIFIVRMESIAEYLDCQRGILDAISASGATRSGGAERYAPRDRDRHCTGRPGPAYHPRMHRASVERSSVRTGYLAALAAAVLLSTTAIFIRSLSRDYGLPALVLAFWRDVFAVATLVPVLAISAPALLRPGKARLPFLAVYGFVLAAFNALWTLSVAMNGAAVATVLVYSSAAFTAVLGRIFLRESLSWGKVVAVLLAVGGCALVARVFEAGSLKAGAAGAAVGIGSGLSYAVYSLLGRSASRRGLDPWTTLLYVFAFAALALMVADLASSALTVGRGLPAARGLPGSSGGPAGLFAPALPSAGWILLVVLAAGPTVMGFGLFLVSLKHLSASVASLVVTLEPLFTAALAYAFLGERLTAVQAAGGLFIVSGVVLLRISERGRS